MLSIILAYASAIINGCGRVTNRYMMKKTDLAIYIFITEALGAIFLFPLIFIKLDMPSGIFEWFVALLGGLVWFFTLYTGYSSNKYLEISTRETIGRIRVIFVLLLALVIFKEAITITKIIGAVLIIGGAWFVSNHKGVQIDKNHMKGVLLTILSVALVSIAFMIDKYATKIMSVGFYSWWTWMMCFILILPFALPKIGEIRKISSHDLKITAITIFFLSISYYILVNAFKIGEVSKVVLVNEVSTVVAVIGGIIILKERSHIGIKIISAATVIIGTIIVSL